MTQVSAPEKGSMRAHLIKGISGSIIIQTGFAGLTFFNAIILARVLGPGGFGAFANAMAWVSLLVIPATFGFGTLIVRDVAIYRYGQEWALLKGLLRFSNRFVLVLSVLLALIGGAAAAFLFSVPEQKTMQLSIWIAAPLVPLLALYNLRESAIRGFEHVIRAQLPGMIIRPGLLLAGIVVIYLCWSEHLSAPAAMAVNVLAGVAALAVGTLWLNRLRPFEVEAVETEYETRSWLHAAFPMMVYSGMQIVLGQTDILMLGAMRSAQEVGLYAAAIRLSFLLVYVIMASNMILAPIIARLHANDEKGKLQLIMSRLVRIAFFTVLPFGLVLIIAGDYVLIIFGRDFLATRLALAILSVGRLLDVALGSCSLVLVMVGHERIVAIIFTIISLGNIVLNALLIPGFGLPGAAVASSISLISAKLLLSAYAAKHANLHTTVFGNLSLIKGSRIVT